MENPDTKPRSLKTQGAWLVFAKVVGFAFSFVLPLVVVRYLTQDQVGQYREAFQVIMNAVVLLPLGVSMSAYYFLARESEERRGAAIFNILVFNFIVGGLACLALYLFPQLIGNLFRSDELTALAPKIGIVIWFWVFATFLETVAVANQEARAATAFIILSQVSKTLLMGAAVFAFASVEAFIYAAMIQGVLQTFVLFLYLRSRFPRFWRGFDLGFLREQLVYAIPYGLAGALWMAQNDVHNYFVGHQFSPSDFAVYAYGCFEVPLISMLTESVTSVLIPRMNQLQLAGDREEMIRLTARAMQKLAFFCFPIYVFLVITSHTFITTLFTEKYEASIGIFIINLTILPSCILVNDPIVRSYKELGRVFLLARICILSGLVSVLYFGLGRFGLTGMITVAVGAVMTEKLMASAMVIHKLNIGFRHLTLLSDVAKTAMISIVAGLFTYLIYDNFHVSLLNAGKQLAVGVISGAQPNLVNFLGGSFVMFVSASVFVPIYLLGSSLWGVIDDDEKRTIRDLYSRIVARRESPHLPGTRA